MNTPSQKAKSSNSSFNEFQNIYPVSKTLGFRLVPDPSTLEFIKKNDFIPSANTLNEDYTILKGAADRIHRRFIEDTLTKLRLPYPILQEYLDATQQEDKEKREKLLSETTKKLKDIISKAFKEARYDDKDSFLSALAGEKLLKNLLPEEVNNDAEKEALARLRRYTTYMRPYFEARARLYSDDSKGHTIPNRIIDDNLPIVLANIKAFEKLPDTVIDGVRPVFEAVKPAWAQDVREVFMLSYACLLNAQSAIDAYNTLIGGISNEDGTRLQGLNELINLHNQQLDASHKKEALPRIKKLKKQILSEAGTFSWISEAIENDEQVVSRLDAVKQALSSFDYSSILNIEETDTTAVFIRADRLNNFSHDIWGDWRLAATAIKDQLREQTPRKPRESETGYEKRIDKDFKNIPHFSLATLLDAMHAKCIAADLSAFTHRAEELISNVNSYRALMDEHLAALESENALRNQRTGKGEVNARTLIKQWLDALMSLCGMTEYFTYTNGAEIVDAKWYADTVDEWIDFRPVLKGAYNTIRNYLTKKPFSTDKLRIYFGAPSLLAGWADSKVPESRGVILKKDDTPYLGIVIDKKLFDEAPLDMGSPWRKLNINRIAGASKSLAKVFQDSTPDGSGNLAIYKPSKEVYELYLATKRKERTSSSYTPDEVKMMVEFFQHCLQTKPSWKDMNIQTRPAGEYKSMNEFFEDIDKQDFAPSLSPIRQSFIEDAVHDGRLLLFQITCQDMSAAHHGKDGNYKVILEELLSERNMQEHNIKLLGDAAIYFRKSSLVRKVTHPAGVPIANKNPDAKTPTRTLAYDIIKDRRYTEDRWMLHLPVMLNPKADSKGERTINNRVRAYMREHPEMYVLGINRGERNLLSVAVTAPDGTIVEQRNLNIFDGYDYRKALAKREGERKAQQQGWEQQTAIKDLKKGYLSRAIGEVVRLVKKYNCAIALESLDMAFRSGRQKFERQVYATFEAALIGRLGFLMDKEDADRTQTVLQLTRIGQTAEERTKWSQNGIVFFLSPAWITKTDPITGFANRLNTHYENAEKAKDFVRAFDLIRYNPTTDRFEFHFRYESFPAGKNAGDPKRTWCVETYGERIENTSDEKTGSPKDIHHDITTEFKTLFNEQSVNYLTGKDIRDEICAKLSATAWNEFYKCLRLTLQNTNWDSDTREYSVIGCTTLNGRFFDSRYAPETMPKDADISAARCLAMKAHMAMRNIRDYDEQNPPRTNTGKIVPVKTYVTDDEWFLYVQE